MKNLFTLLLIISLCACSSENNNDYNFDKLGGYDKKFDFSNIDIEGLLITDCWGDYDHTQFPTTNENTRELWGKDYVVLKGSRDNTYAWIGVFDYYTHEYIYDYTDWDKPIGYTEYGEEKKYEITDIWSTKLMFGENFFAIPLYYSDSTRNRTELDIVVCKTDGTTIRRKMYEWNNRSTEEGSHNTGKLFDYLFFYNYYSHASAPKEEELIVVWYDSKRNKFHEFTLPLIYIIRDAFRYSYPNLAHILIDPNDCESWAAYTEPRQSIQSVAYDHGRLTDIQKIDIFDEYTGSDDQAPQYIVEYLEQEINNRLIKVTRITYDGTRESKNVRISLDNSDSHITVH